MQMPLVIRLPLPELLPPRATGGFTAITCTFPLCFFSLINLPPDSLSVLALSARHNCIYVKSAACECLLLFFLRFPLHCDVSSAAPLAAASAVSLLQSGNARVVKVALQMLDHLIGHSRRVTRRLLGSVANYNLIKPIFSVKPGNEWRTTVRGQDIDTLLRELRAMQDDGCHQHASHEQRHGVKDLGDQALRVHRRISEIGGVVCKAPRTELAALIGNGCEAADVQAAGYCASEVKALSKSAREMRGMGWQLEDLIGAGFDASALLASGYTPSELRNAGVTASQLKAAACSAHRLKSAGFSAFELRAAGFDLGSLIVGGYDAMALKRAGFVGM
jgi:hypothetical protein